MFGLRGTDNYSPGYGNAHLFTLPASSLATQFTWHGAADDLKWPRDSHASQSFLRMITLLTTQPPKRRVCPRAGAQPGLLAVPHPNLSVDFLCSTAGGTALTKINSRYD